MTFPSPRKSTSQVPQVPNQVVKIQKRIKYHICRKKSQKRIKYHICRKKSQKRIKYKLNNARASDSETNKVGGGGRFEPGLRAFEAAALSTRPRNMPR
jgi:hypothetical protein